MDMTLPVLFLFLLSFFLISIKKYFIGFLFFMVAAVGLFFVVNSYFEKKREQKQKKENETKEKILKESTNR